MYRAPTPRHARVAGAFVDWGIPTVDSVRYCRQGAPNLPIIASGGIKNGIDVAKCIALGASAVGFAGVFLRAAVNSGVAGVIDVAGAITDELRIAMFSSGSGDLTSLASQQLYERE
jgi:isopentenyl-diphosphate delta-isomerase